MDHDVSNHLLTSDRDDLENILDEDVASGTDQAQDKYRAAMIERLNADKEAKILTFKQRAPKAQEGKNPGRGALSFFLVGVYHTGFQR